MTLAKPAFGLNRILLASVACLAVTACGAQQSDDPISVVGSSTVYPFAQKVAVDMVASDKGVAEPVITSTGSSEGIEAFCQGVGPDTPDIVNASRRMSMTEFTLCQKSGVEEIIEVKIGLDGIVFASAREGGIDLSLTSDTVYKALAANPFGKEQLSANWRDIGDGLPNEPILVYGPSSTSGTRDALLEVIMMPACTANGVMADLKKSDLAAFERNCHTLRSDSAYIEQGEKDDLIVGKITNNPRAIGIFGYSYLEENDAAIMGLTLDGVAPSAQAIADGSYPGSRPLYLYVKKAHIGVTPGLEKYLTQWAESWSANGPLSAIGLVPATQEMQAKSAAIIENQSILTAADLTP